MTEQKHDDACGASHSDAVLAAELNRGGFPVKNASYWRRQYLDMQAMYDAQCSCTDEWAEKYQAEVERKGDEALLRRVKELEDALAVVNARLAAANGGVQAPCAASCARSPGTKCYSARGIRDEG